LGGEMKEVILYSIFLLLAIILFDLIVAIFKAYIEINKLKEGR